MYMDYAYGLRIWITHMDYAYGLRVLGIARGEVCLHSMVGMVVGDMEVWMKVGFAWLGK